ncbi:MAG TPA: hypothetical protein VEG38_09810 [Acidimicrobiia bacterium]|nr:hypothetical protein [Acidimicrobiia bacterium]
MGYTREAGVRDLERQIGRILRKVATKVASGTAELPVRVDVDDGRPLIGRRRFVDEAKERTSVPWGSPGRGRGRRLRRRAPRRSARAASTYASMSGLPRSDAMRPASSS